MQVDKGANDPDFMQSLARGLEVVRCFAKRERPLTIAQAAAETGYSRAAVRRCLHTLAVPVLEHGKVVAALNVGTQPTRVSTADLRSRCFPSLRRLARALSIGGPLRSEF